MSSITLKNLSMTIFGESHGSMIGGVITNLPAGHKIDEEKIYKDVLRRKPGNDCLSTSRNESDNFEIISGVYNGYTTGAPLCVLIKNCDFHSSDYLNLKNTPRPSHSDYSAYIKYNGFNDIRGGGHFSGRLTAPIVVLGSICKQILEKERIDVLSHVLKVMDIEDKSFLSSTDDEILKIKSGKMTILDLEDKIIKRIEEAKENKDSLGAKIECVVTNMKKGVGGPLFEGMEGKLANLLYAIPGVKSVEFGLGEEFSQSFGSKVNDSYTLIDNTVRTVSNNNGGILGGITNGENIVMKITFKPTPSIFKEQQTVNLETLEKETLILKGRHDPVIALRAMPVLEAITAFGILDSIL